MNFLLRLESDGYTGTECRVQWDLLTNKSPLLELFRLEINLNSVVSHDVHEYSKISHEGVTGILVFETISG